jgi:hypothetical protein
VGALTVASTAAVTLRFGRAGALSRDESVFVYAGQQLANGVSPYDSIFEQKGPLTALVIAAAVKMSDWTGLDDLSVVRLTFFLITCLGVALMYWLGVELFGSVVPAALSAAVFGTFYRFARDAWGGPDPKTLCLVLSLAVFLAMIHRRWLVAGLLAGLATLTWQVMVFLIVIVAVTAVLADRRDRLRALGHAVLGPIVIAAGLAAWLVSSGDFGRFLDASVAFPLTGALHVDATWALRVDRIQTVVFEDYGLSGYVLVGGLVLFVVLGGRVAWRHRHELHDPRSLSTFMALGPTCLVALAYINVDFQGGPDLFPLMPYAALGWGLAVQAIASGVSAARPVRLHVGATLAVVLAVAVLGYSWVSFGADDDNGKLDEQRRDAAVLQRMAGPDGGVLALGNPAPLVLTHRTNPDRIIFLSSGVAAWKVERTEGGLDGWKSEILQASPRVVVVHRTGSPIVAELVTWLRSEGYESTRVGQWLTLQST